MAELGDELADVGGAVCDAVDPFVGEFFVAFEGAGASGSAGVSSEASAGSSNDAGKPLMCLFIDLTRTNTAMKKTISRTRPTGEDLPKSSPWPPLSSSFVFDGCTATSATVLPTEKSGESTPRP